MDQRYNFHGEWSWSNICPERSSFEFYMSSATSSGTQRTQGEAAVVGVSVPIRTCSPVSRPTIDLYLTRPMIDHRDDHSTLHESRHSCNGKVIASRDVKPPR